MPQVFAKIIKKEQLKDDLFKFSVKSDEIVKMSRPGNFIEIRVNNQTEPFLRRPISIHNMDKSNGILEFIFQVKGKGTKILSEKAVGENLDIIGPLGYGTFKYEDYQNISILGGGIGIFPLYELAKNAKLSNKTVNSYLGFRNKDLVVLEEEFKKVSNNLVITTDDGSYAQHGFAINFLKEDFEKRKIDCIYACRSITYVKSYKRFRFGKEYSLPNFT